MVPLGRSACCVLATRCLPRSRAAFDGGLEKKQVQQNTEAICQNVDTLSIISIRSHLVSRYIVYEYSRLLKPCVGIDTHRGRCATRAPRGRERVLPTDRPGLGFPTPVPASIPTIGQRRAASQARRLCFLQVLRVLPCCMTDFQGTQARSVGEESRVERVFGYGICKNKAHVIANLDGQWEHSGRLVMGRSTLMTYSHGCIVGQARIWQAPNGACTGVLENCKW